MAILLCAFASINGCAAPQPPVLQSKSWQWQGFTGHAITTAHYRIYTTVNDDALLHRFASLMEAAHTQYAALCAPASPEDRPLEIDLFADQSQWINFTFQTAGNDARVYAQINRGGYAIGDRFVCWVTDEHELFSTAAHEGFHQYVARHFVTRLPPALEEGIATTFETVAVSDTGVSFDLTHNVRRKTGLTTADAAGDLLPLDTLIQLHAGDVVRADGVHSEGFYGQCWALAEMLLHSGVYRPATLQMIADLQAGHPRVSIGANTRLGLYRPAAIKPLLQAYVAPNWTAFVSDYTHFCASQH